MPKTSSPGAVSPADYLPLAGKILLLAVAAEFLLLRGINRMTGQVPSWAREEIAQGLVFLGTVSYNLGYVASIATLVVVGYILFQREDRLTPMILVWIAALIVGQFLGPAIPAAIVAAGLLAAILMATLAVRVILRVLRAQGSASVGAGGLHPARRVFFPAFLVLLVGTYFTGLYLHLGDALAAMGLGPPARPDVYRTGEALALATAFLAPSVAWVRPNRKNVILPATALLVFAAATAARPDLVPLIGFWSLGFQLFLPLELYFAALAVYLYAFASAATSMDRFGYRFHGLFLIFLGGRFVPDFYFIGLALIGVVFIAMGKELSRPTSQIEMGPQPSAPTGSEGAAV